MSTNHGTDFKWSIYGDGGFSELEHLSVGVIVLDRNKTIGIEEWSICGGCRLERFYCVYTYIFRYIIMEIHIHVYVCVCIYIYILQHMHIHFCECISIVIMIYRNIYRYPKTCVVCTDLSGKSHTGRRG